MTSEERFRDLRKRVMRAIEEVYEDSHYGKSYEGTFEWTECYPNFWEDEKGEKGASWYTLSLDCYLLGPDRHTKWYGKTKDECLYKAEQEIGKWLSDVIL